MVATKHITGRDSQGGKTWLYDHIEVAKALFSYVNLQVNNSVGGKTIQGRGHHPMPPAGMWLVATKGNREVLNK